MSWSISVTFLTTFVKEKGAGIPPKAKALGLLSED